MIIKGTTKPCTLESLATIDQSLLLKGLRGLYPLQNIWGSWAPRKESKKKRNSSIFSIISPERPLAIRAYGQTLYFSNLRYTALMFKSNSWIISTCFSSNIEFMVSNHQTTNCSSNFSQFAALEKENFLLIQNSFSFQFTSWKTNHNKYSFKNFLDWEFVV